MKLTKQAACLLGVVLFALPALAEGPYGLVEAVVAAAEVDATYEPFRPDAPVTLVGSFVGSVRAHNAIADTTVCWAPTDVYTRERYGNYCITNKFTGLVPNATYRFELHSSENNGSFSTVGKRDFNLFLQNVQVLTNFDEIAEIGHKTPYVRAFETQANASGEIVASFTKAHYDVPHYCGLALFGTNAPSAVKNFIVSRKGNALHCTWSKSTDVLRYHVAGRPVGSTDWQPLATVYGDVTACDAPVSDFSTDWEVRLTASNGVGVASAEVTAGSAFPVYTFNCDVAQKFVGTFCPADFLSTTQRGIYNNTYGTATPPAGVNPGAPLEVATTTLYGKQIRFTLPNLRADKTYELRIWHSESYHTNVNMRVWSISCNGTALRQDIDSYALLGGRNILGILSFPGLAPNAQNQIVVDLAASKDNVSPLAIGLYEEGSSGIPLVPAVEVTAVDDMRGHATFVKPHYGTGDLLYTVRRKAAGADDSTAEILAADTPNRTVVDPGVTEGYVYSVRAANETGASDWSPWQAPSTTRASYKGLHMDRTSTATISGGLHGKFTSIGSELLPENYNLSTANQSHDVTRAWEPAPQAVYTKQLYAGTIRFAVTNLVPGATYRVRIHSSEDYTGAQADGKRVFTALANGVSIFSGLDLWKETKALYHIIIKEVKTVASADGLIHFRLDKSADNASISAVECILDYADDTAGLATRTTNGITQKQGAISVPQDGSYTFTLSPSSAFSLWIDEKVVVEKTATSGSITLAAGRHDIFVRHPEGSELRWSGPGLSERALAAPFTSHVDGTDMDISPWQEVQVGGGAVSGYVTRRYDRVMLEHSLYMLAAGADIWAGTDQEKLAYQEIPGGRDFTMTALLRDTTIKHNNAKVGIEFRSSIDGTLANNYLYTLAYSVGLRKIVVSGGDFTDGSAVNLTEPYAGTDYVVLPIWFKWEVKTVNGRRTATGYTSNDGVTWTERYVVPKPIPRTAKVYVGANVCSHDVLGGSIFRDLTLDVAPPQSTWLILR